MAPTAAPARPAWWARLVARIPLRALYGFAGFLGWLAFRVFPYRERVVRENLTRAFPDFDEARLRSVMRGYYLGFAQMLVEVIKSVTLPADEIRRRVRIVTLEAAHTLLEQGQSVLLVAAHQCNWEWMLLALSIELGYPLDAAYKPLVDNWAEREMRKVRTRFGCRLVPAKDLLPALINPRALVPAVAPAPAHQPPTGAP